MKFLMILKYVILVILVITGIRLVLIILAIGIKWVVDKLVEMRKRKLRNKYYKVKVVS